MLPWVDGFHWTAVHIIFLTVFFAALLIIASTVFFAIRRTAAEFHTHRATTTCWHEAFAELPEAERHCRHEFAGRVPLRVCDNAFDCRSCQRYEGFAGLPSRLSANNAAVPYSDTLLYHRGHTWVRPEWDGTFTIGLDEFARHLIGQPEKVELPEPGQDLEIDGVAWRMTKNGYTIRVRAPFDGTVLCTCAGKEGWYLNVLPKDPVNLKHLLHGPEVRAWLNHEVDRLQLRLAAPNAPPCLADGGMLMPDLMDEEPQADWDTVLAETFLDS
jgi:glycine cleavage system H lipoate-binding protein